MTDTSLINDGRDALDWDPIERARGGFRVFASGCPRSRGSTDPRDQDAATVELADKWLLELAVQIFADQFRLGEPDEVANSASRAIEQLNVELGESVYRVMLRELKHPSDK